MKYFFYILLILIFISCKKHRKINVDGYVTDAFKGTPVSNVRIILHSSIEINHLSEDYYTTTDANGYYRFTKACFSKPAMYGYVDIAASSISLYHSAKGLYYSTTGSELDIDTKDIKMFGKTNLKRNIKTNCNAILNLNVIVNNSNATNIRLSRIYYGEPTYKNGEEVFNTGPYLFSNSINLSGLIVGYSEGRTIIKSIIIDQFGNTIKTQNDTIQSAGCGTTNNYTITIN